MHNVVFGCADNLFQVTTIAGKNGNGLVVVKAGSV